MLTLVALERCATARCAIEMMGSMAESMGYYGAEANQGEGGEGLTIIDTAEAWVFHILPDQAGTGAIWAAQRVPDTHVAVIANAFIIREVEEDNDDFITSSNLWSAAKNAGLWSHKDGKLDFAKVKYMLGERGWRFRDV